MKRWILAALLVLAPLAATAQVPGVAIQPTQAPQFGIGPTASTAYEAQHVLKATPGNLYSISVYANVSGWVSLVDSATSLAVGAVVPVWCKYVQANDQTLRPFHWEPPLRFSSGIVAAFSTGGCFNFTNANLNAAYFSATIQ